MSAWDEIINSFLLLPVGWDSYGSTKISPIAVQEAKLILDSLSALPGQWFVVPTASGGISIERHDRFIDIEISVEPVEET